VILVDRIGILAKLYQLGFLAFVGGSFYGSVHNVMEPAALSKPVIFGPHIHNSYEALQLVQIGAGMVVKNAEEMANRIRELISDPQLCDKMGQLGKSLIEKNLGATERTLSHLRSILMAK
jgi:3-deoxy-D-manno-octulosonic-acid transferase